jgi:Fic family protein
LAKGARGTAAIEGNTLSEEQVLEHLDKKLVLPPSKEYMRQEMDNIINTLNEIGETVLGRASVKLSPDIITNYNAKVLNGLSLEDGVIPGNIRHHSVGIVGTNYRGAPAKDCEFLLEQMCDWLNDAFDPADAKDSVVYGLIKAVLAHLYLAWIHPFGDGNGRTARLVEFHILLSSGVPTPAAHLLSNYYNETRALYYRQLDLASKSGGDIIPFIDYAVTGFVEGLRVQLDLIWTQQLDVTWRNYVHESFANRKGQANTRRKHLALDLSRSSDSVPRDQIPELSTRLAAAYAGKSAKTWSRDIKVLKDMMLIVEDQNGCKAFKSIIRQFLPASLR